MSDSDSCCLGSNPSSPASLSAAENRDKSAEIRHPERAAWLEQTETRRAQIPAQTPTDLLLLKTPDELTAFESRFWSKIEIGAADECWPWKASRNQHQYGKVKVRSYVVATASRVAYALAKGDPGRLLVCHSCDNPPCCNPAHLFLGTDADNMRDMAAKGRAYNGDRRGEKNGTAKITEAQAQEIKALIAAGLNNTEIAERFPVGHALVSRIRRGKAWAHVSPAP